MPLDDAIAKKRPEKVSPIRHDPPGAVTSMPSPAKIHHVHIARAAQIFSSRAALSQQILARTASLTGAVSMNSAAGSASSSG